MTSSLLVVFALLLIGQLADSLPDVDVDAQSLTESDKKNNDEDGKLMNDRFFNEMLLQLKEPFLQQVKIESEQPSIDSTQGGDGVLVVNNEGQTGMEPEERTGNQARKISKETRNKLLKAGLKIATKVALNAAFRG